MIWKDRESQPINLKNIYLMLSARVAKRWKRDSEISLEGYVGATYEFKEYIPYVI